MRAIRRAVAATGVLALAACGSVMTKHGYAPLDEELAEIREGVDTRGSVQRKIGRPALSGTFDDAGWYYVTTTIEEKTYHAPRVVDRRVVAVLFDEQDVVAGVATLTLADGRVVDLEARTTPTYGSRLTIVEQLLGNIGRLSGDELLGDE